MTPTEVLRHEHQIVLLILEAAEREAQSIKDTGEARAKDLEKMIDFFRNFTDRCHHAKEEKHLFARMQERGMSRDAGPIPLMRHEHEEGRAKVKAMAEALPRARKGDVAALKSLRESLLAYVKLLRSHIEKEEKVLFPMADQLLPAGDQRALERAFEKVEAEEMGEGVHEKYHQLAHDLAGREKP